MHPGRFPEPHRPAPRAKALRALGARLSDGLLELGLRVLLGALERAEARAPQAFVDLPEREAPLRPDVEREARGEAGAERVLRVA